MTDTNIYKAYIPPTFGKKPETPQEALLSAAALLEEEGRWNQGTWFDHHNPNMDEYRDDPYCNSWSACADGALQIVTIGLAKHEAFADVVIWDSLTDGAYLEPYERDESVKPEMKLYSEAKDLLTNAIRNTTKNDYEEVVSFNDNNDRDSIVSLMRSAANNEA